MGVKVFIRGGNLDKINSVMDYARGEGSVKLREGMKKILIEGNIRDRLAGVDYMGRKLAKLAASTLSPAGIRKRGGDGPPLAPRRMGSRSITGFRVRGKIDGDRQYLIASVEALSRRGFPFLGAHAAGTVPRAPRRDILGVSPKTRNAGVAFRRRWFADMHRRTK